MWKTRGAKGTRSVFSWTATLTTIIAIAIVSFFVGRELGVFSKSTDGMKYHPWSAELAPLTESVEDASNEEIVETSDVAEELEATSGGENADGGETTETSEDAAAE